MTSRCKLLFLHVVETRLYFFISALTQKVREKIYRIIGLDKVPRLHHSLKIWMTFSLVSIVWIFFRAQSISDAIYVLSHLMTGWQEIFKPGVLMNTAPWDSLRFEWITGLVSIGVLFLIEWGERHGSIVETLSTKANGSILRNTPGSSIQND